MSPFLRQGAFCLIFLLAISSAVFAQGTLADYGRYETLHERMQGKVTHLSVKPNWIGDTGRFWYRDDAGDGRRQFVLVNAGQGIKAPAFDHARLANALGSMLGKRFDPERLPLEAIDFTGVPSGSMRLQTGGRSFVCDLTTYVLTPDAATLNTLRARVPGSVAASRTTGDETAITFVNRSGVPLDLIWLDLDGLRHSYGTLPADGEREMHTYAEHAWLAIAHDGGKPLAAFIAGERPGTAVVEKTPAIPRPETKPAESPQNGHGNAFIRDNNVFIGDRRTGAETALTHDGSRADAYEAPIFWSPDGKKFVVYKTIPAQEHKVYFVESSPRDQKQPKLHSIDYLKPGDRVAVSRPHLFDAATGRDIPIATDLFANPFDLSEPRWSPDSAEFTFVYNQRGHQILRIVGVNAATGAARAIVDERSKTFIDYSGKQFADYDDATGEIVWMSERDGWNHLYLYDARTGAVKNQITHGPWVVRGVDRVDTAKRQVWFHAGGVFAGQDPYYVQYGRVNSDGSGLTWLTRADGTHTVSYSPDGKYLVDTYSRVDLPPITELRRASDGSLILPLEKADDSALVAAGWRAPEAFVAKGRDGVTDIYGVIFRPTNFDPARHYPVIEDIYAGPQDSYVPKAFSPFYNPQELAEIGFVTVQIDGMGTSNRSKAFHDVCYKNLGDAGFPDRIRWMQAAAQKYSYLDLTRVGIYGVSAGGQDAARAPMTHGDFYKAAVSDSGCHDNQMDKIWWNEQWMGWPVGPEYDASSNVVAAKNLSGKLMLVVGEMDTNVDPASTMQVVDALIKADKDFDLLVVPGGGHGAGESAYGKRRRADFFVRNLLGVEPRR